MITMGLRKTRSDCSLETFANINGFDENAFRNEYGRKTRKKINSYYFFLSLLLGGLPSIFFH